MMITKLLTKTTLCCLLLSSPASWGFVAVAVNYGAPTANEQAALDKINRFRAAPQSELAAMFTENFTGTYSNGNIQGLLENVNWSANFWKNTFGSNTVSASMDFFNTRPGTLYSQFQTISAATSPLSWSDNIGWAAHQYATWVEIDAGANSNPHAIPGAPTLGARFTNAGVGWTGVAENIAANWPLNVNQIHMGFAVDWGPGVDGIQSPPGHRNAMMNNSYNRLGIGIVDAGWTAASVTNVQHFANVSSTTPIVYGFVYDANGNRQAGITVQVRDSSNNLLGTAVTDAIGAYTYKVISGTPSAAVYTNGIISSNPLTLGASGGNWFLDVTIPEPTSCLLVAVAAPLLLLRRRRAGV